MSLLARTRGAVAWGLLGAAARMVLQFVGQVAIARLLGPSQMGAFATAFLIVTLCNIFADWGFAYGLIRQREVSPDDVRSVLGMQIFTGAGASLLLAVTAPLIESVVGINDVAVLLQVLAPVCLIQSASAVAANLLKRSLDLKFLQVAQLTGYAVGYLLVGIPLAWLLKSAWALVAAVVCQAIVITLMLYARVRHPLCPSFRFSASGETERFGATVLLTNLVNWFLASADRLLVANAFGSHAAGIYSVASTIVSTPATALVSVTQPVFYSAYCRTSEIGHKNESSYLLSLEAACFFVLTGSVVFFAMTPEIVDFVYGRDWAESKDIVRPISLAMAMFLLSSLVTPVLWAGGRELVEVKVQTVVAVAWLICGLVAMRFSIVAVAWSVVFAQVLKFVFFNGALCRAFCIRSSDVLRAVLPGVLLSTLLWLVFEQLGSRAEPFLKFSAGTNFVLSLGAHAILWSIFLLGWCAIVSSRPWRILFAAIKGKAIIGENQVE